MKAADCPDDSMPGGQERRKRNAGAVILSGVSRRLFFSPFLRAVGTRSRRISLELTFNALPQ